MLEFDKSGRARASARGACAWVVGEAGDTMIEVVIAALIVGLIAAATFTGFSGAAHIAGAQRHQAESDVLAQQDEERLRGLSVVELAAIEPSGNTAANSAQLYGNASYTETIDNETYTVTSVAKFVSASTGSLSCATSGLGPASYVETSSTVTWNNNNDGRPPIIEHSLISPSPGGSLTTSVVNSANSPVAGATISVEGPGTSTSTTTLTTDSNGCAVFGGLVGGTYTVTATDPGYVTDTGASSPTQSVVLLAATTQTLQPFQLDQAAVQATFLTSIDDASPIGINWDTFTLTDSNETQSFGTAGTPTSPVNTGSVYPATYNAYAGTCSSDDPGGSTGTTGLTGATYTDPTVSPASGATGSVAVTVPTMLVQPTLSYTTTSTTTTPVTTSPLPYTVKTYDSCSMGRTLVTSPSAITVGTQTVYPVLAPYGMSVQLCFANAGTTTNTGELPATIANTNLNGTKVTPVTLPVASGATGASGVFKNPGATCP